MSQNINSEEIPSGSRTVFTAAQIMTLQSQVKSFKDLSTRYSELEISKIIEKNASQTSLPPTYTSGAVQMTNNASSASLPASVNTNNMSSSQQPSKQQSLAQSTIPHQSNIASKLYQQSAPSHITAQSAKINQQQAPSFSQQQQQHQPNQQFPRQQQYSQQQHPPSAAGAGAQMTSGTLPVNTANQKPSNAGYAPPTATTTLSWQCFGSLLFAAPSSSAADAKKATENLETLSVAYHNVDPFLKSNSTSSTFTRPYSVSLREKLIREMMMSSLMTTTDPSKKRELDLLYKQRIARSQLALQFKPSESVSKPIMLNPRKNAPKERKISKRDMRAREKELQRQKQGLDETRKKKQAEFMRVLFGHREEFLKFHKDKRMDLTRTARLAKQYIESLDAKKGKEEIRTEQLRLLALKQNDMEAYSKLVDETKNERLRFLLSETDSFILSIQDKIDQQRAIGSQDEEIRVSEEAALKGTSLLGSNNMNEKNRVTLNASFAGSASMSYLEQTHRLTEKVMQPSMLKGGQLKEYQLEGLRWMVSLYNNNLNGILADEMGLGKTIQTIALLSYLIEFKSNKGPFLIVVPLSTLSNWVNECTKWSPEIIKVVYRGSPTIRRNIYKDEVEHGRFNVLITTYEYIMRDKSALKRIKWQYVIVDEGHRMKNAQSKFAQILGNQYHSKHRILLTGTPLQNNLPELWALLNFLLPYIFGSMESFDQWFNQPFAAFQASKRETTTEQGDAEMAQLSQEERLLVVHRLHEVLRPFMLRRVKSQVLDQLPDKVENIIRCRLSGWQRKLYRVIQEKTRAVDGEVNRGGINNILMQLRKVCNHPYLFLNEWYADDDLIRASGKFELLDRMLPKLKAGGHRILMFSQMTHVMTLLEKFFEMKGYQYLRLDGGTSAEEREKRMFMFNEPESPYFIFLLSTRAGGLGLNLASADTVFIFDSDWNPMMDAQAQDRAHRIGQKNEVHVFRLITTTAVEEKILSRAALKISLNGLVVEAGEFNMKAGASSTSLGEVNDDRREMMEALMREWSGEGADAENEMDNAVPDDDQINEMMASSEAEVELYQRLDQEREADRIRHITDGSEPLPRLMEANAPPSWLTHSHFTSTNSSIAAQMMDANNDGLTKKQKSQDFDDELDAEDGEIIEKKSVDPPTRKRKNVKYDDAMTDNQFVRFIENGGELAIEPLSKRVRNGDFTVDTQIALHKMIKKIIKTKKMEGSNTVELFLKKPDKKLFPDYYVLIENPISLKEIFEKLKKAEYLSFEELDADFGLLVDNARTYNEDGSFVVLASEELHGLYMDGAAEYRRSEK